MLRRSTRTLLAVLACLLLAGTSAHAALPLTGDAQKTLASVERLDEDFYCVEYHGDYGLDALMETGVEDAQALGAFISEKLLYGLPFQRDQLWLSCSAFAAETPGGDFIQGRNMDFAFAQNILVRTRPENGYASLGMASGALLGYLDDVPDNVLGRLLLLASPYYILDGINEAGLSMSTLLQTYADVVWQDTGKPAMVTTMAIRMVLDRAATVQEAVDLLDAYDMRGMANSNFHFLLVDAEGDRAVIEYVDNEMRVLRSDGYGLPVTNFFLSEDVQEEYRDGEDRIAVLQAALDENQGVVANETAWAMLDSVKALHDYDPVNDIDYNTAYSMIFNSTKRSLDVCINMHFDAVHSFSVEGAFGAE